MIRFIINLWLIAASLVVGGYLYLQVSEGHIKMPPEVEATARRILVGPTATPLPTATAVARIAAAPGSGEAFSQAQQAARTAALQPLWTTNECNRAYTILTEAKSAHQNYRDQLRQGPQAISQYVRQPSGSPYPYNYALKWEEEWTANYDFLIDLTNRVCVP